MKTKRYDQDDSEDEKEVQSSDGGVDKRPDYINNQDGRHKSER